MREEEENYWNIWNFWVSYWKIWLRKLLVRNEALSKLFCSYIKVNVKALIVTFCLGTRNLRTCDIFYHLLSPLFGHYKTIGFCYGWKPRDNSHRKSTSAMPHRGVLNSHTWPPLLLCVSDNYLLADCDCDCDCVLHMHVLATHSQFACIITANALFQDTDTGSTNE